MREIHIDVSKELRRGILGSMLPGAVPAVILALAGYYIAAYFVELLSFATIYAALLMRNAWRLRSFWIGVSIAVVVDVMVIANLQSTRHDFPFIVFTPLAILYCVGLVYGLQWLAFHIDETKIIFDQ